MPFPAARWQDYCSNMKDKLFKDFLVSYYNVALIAFMEANSTSIADIKGHGPKAMKFDVWNGLVDHWLDSKWQNNSVIDKKIELLCLLINYTHYMVYQFWRTQEKKVIKKNIAYLK
ncbi:hypothetical protein Ahy_A03g012823 [Arachis hypogaea]|uniref:Uncharacterized protein n=1 Tax=Arachis hypogaea TaxID=3818 RepID=A0A445DUH5_ARAHY|nr:hypothetical protein Ahy_A03g012823 [Arachis hypogaea]